MFREFIDRWKDRNYQRRHGAHDRRREEMFALFRALPGGAGMLDQAEKDGVGIVVGPKWRGHQHDGLVETDKNGTFVFIANTGDPVAMTLKLRHELRHIAQLREEDVLHVEQPLLSTDVRAGHIRSLMAEADAFTSEVILALQQKKSGNDAYYNSLLEWGDVGRFTRKFLEKTPYESYGSDESFCRACFTEFMLGGLGHYRREYLFRYASAFEDAEDVGAFRARMEKAPAEPKTIGAALADQYGAEFITATSLRALEAAFFQAQPAAERFTLGLIQKAIRNAGGLEADEYLALRRKIVERVRENAFEPLPVVEWSKAAAAAETLRASAPAEKPPVMKDFAQAARRHAAEKSAALQKALGLSPRRFP